MKIPCLVLLATVVVVETRSVKEAGSIFQMECSNDNDRRLLVVRNCAEILNTRFTDCITTYQNSPMQAYNSCLKWGCTGAEAFMESEKELCRAVGEAIYPCADINGASNLTARIDNAGCFNSSSLSK